MKTAFVLFLLFTSVVCGVEDSATSALRKALLAEDAEAVRSAVAAGRASLGIRAGEPEVEDKYLPVPGSEPRLSPADAQRGFSRDFGKLEQMRWWKIGVDPTTLTAPLRAPASVVSGCVATVRAKLDGAGRSLAIAKDAADFLLWAQQQAGTGLFPFPAATGTSDARAMEVATRFLRKAKASGRINDVVRNGWAFEDLGDGGLQFDNAECGVAIFELYEVTRDARYLEAARKSSDWAAARPLATNWNYNSFSVYLLAKAFVVTGERRYLEAATKKALLGVIPGQLTEGPHAGRWMDPHNARPAYHYIMVRGLAQLAGVMSASDPARTEVLRALKLALTTRNAEIIGKGVMNKDKAFEALLLVNQSFAKDSVFLGETHSDEALDLLVRGVSAEARRGKFPLAPREWGLFLEYIVTRLSL